MKEIHGEHMGIAFVYSYNADTDSQKGVIQLPEPQVFETPGAGDETWQREARRRIEDYFREIDSEPDDDSEA